MKIISSLSITYKATTVFRMGGHKEFVRTNAHWINRPKNSLNHPGVGGWDKKSKRLKAKQQTIVFLNPSHCTLR